MSYTLRGRIESRLAASLLPFLVAAALAPSCTSGGRSSWSALMLGDRRSSSTWSLYHRVLPYQPGVARARRSACSSSP